MEYDFQWRIETPAQIAIVDSTGFSVLDIHFENWEFGGASNFWLARGFVEASNLNDAIVNFHGKLLKLIPEIALVSQCYTEFHSQPFLVKRADKDFAYFRYVRDSEAVRLVFGNEEQRALNLLLKDNTIPQNFYIYWNEAVNSFGYSSKLLLMFSAIEAIAKGGAPENDKKIFYQKINKIFGKNLKQDLYGTPGNSKSGLRQRLVHREYLSLRDAEKDYVDIVHKKIINYFNGAILNEKLLAEDVVAPQRHVMGNKEGDEIFGGRFIKAIGGKPLDLKDVISESDKNNSGEFENYEYIYDSARTTDF